MNKMAYTNMPKMVTKEQLPPAFIATYIPGTVLSISCGLSHFTLTTAL